MSPRLSRFKSAAAALLIGCLSMGTAQAASILYGTTGSGGASSDLITIDPTTGATIVIGSIGFSINGLTYDRTTGTLYGSARADGGLVTINTTTGAGTLVGAFNSAASGCSDRNVLLASNSAGSLFGWCDPSSDDLMSINKATGQATIVGDAGIVTASHGMAFDNNDTLYMHNFGIYTIDTVTGLATFVASEGNLGHHGDFNHDDGLYYGLGTNGPSGIINVFDLGATNTLQSSIQLDRSDVFTLAFTQDRSSVPEPGTLALVGLVLVGMAAGRRRRQ